MALKVKECASLHTSAEKVLLTSQKKKKNYSKEPYIETWFERKYVPTARLHFDFLASHFQISESSLLLKQSLGKD